MAGRVVTKPENIRKFRYSGGDSSPVYQYVLSPLADWLVDNCTPSWVAPNLITFLDLVAVIIPAAMAVYYSPQFDNKDIPSAVAFAGAVGTFVCQTLDNMDGKQARRTGAGSPLGYLFDHACDALHGTCIAAITMCAVMVTNGGLGGTLGAWPVALAVWCVGAVPFYTSTWESYYTHDLTLPPINGPTEGLLVVAGAHLAAGLYGSSALYQPISALGGLIAIDALLVALVLGVVVTVAAQLVSVYKVQHSRGDSFGAAVGQLLPLAYAVALLVAYGSFEEFWGQHALQPMLMVLVGLALADTLTRLMVAHVCQQEPTPSLVMLALPSLPLLVWHALRQGWIIDASGGWLPFAAVAMVLCAEGMVYCSMVSHVLAVFTRELDCDIFSIKRKHRTD